MSLLPAIVKTALLKASKSPVANPNNSGFPSEIDGQGRISTWRTGRIIKDFSIKITGQTTIDPGWTPLPEKNELPPGWSIDENGYFVCDLPAVNLLREDFVNGELESYPAYLSFARAAEPYSHTRSQMNAYWVGLRFHHWMGKHIPGFWDIHDYKSSEYTDKVIRLRFKDQGEITLYSTHGGYDGKNTNTDEQGATLTLKTEGKVFRLLYESSVANPHRDISYPNQRNENSNFTLLPSSGEIADNIVTAYAIVHAAGRQKNESGKLQKLSDGRLRISASTPQLIAK